MGSVLNWWQRNPVFASVGREQWRSWQWQMRHRIRCAGDLLRAVPNLGKVINAESLIRVDRRFPHLLTPFSVAQLSLLVDQAGERPWLPGMLRTLIGDDRELQPVSLRAIGDDPVGEKPTAHGLRGLSRFYPDRVLVHTGTECPVYCRYCFRRDRIIPDRERQRERAWIISEAEWQQILAYVRESPPREMNAGTDPKIRDVIFSGGDPLVLADGRLQQMLADLRTIPHVKLIRFDTKMIAVNPYRVTEAFLQMVRQYKPVYMNLHFVHPYELNDDVRDACERLADAGVYLGSHTPLLGGVNDEVEILRDLFLGLIEVRVRPYYLIHYIPTEFTAHFRASLEKGRAIIKGLWGHVSGLANPTYIVYLPRGCGKVMYMPDYLLERDPDGYWFETFEGGVAVYPMKVDDER